MLPIHEDRWKKWRRMDLWSLSDAVALWNMWNPDGHYDKQMIDAFDSFSIKPLRDLVIAAVRSGKLTPHQPCNDPLEAFFEPRVFVLWAQTKDVPTPQWWDDLLDESPQMLDAKTPEDIIQRCHEKNITDPYEIARILDDTFTGDRTLSHLELGGLLPADPNISITKGAQRDRGKRLRGLKK